MTRYDLSKLRDVESSLEAIIVAPCASGEERGPGGDSGGIAMVTKYSCSVSSPVETWSALMVTGRVSIPKKVKTMRENPGKDDDHCTYAPVPLLTS